MVMIRDALVEQLKCGPKTIPQMLEPILKDLFVLRTSAMQNAHRVLKKMEADGLVEKTGRGNPKDPFVWRLL